jgi:hypothetical protein
MSVSLCTPERRENIGVKHVMQMEPKVPASITCVRQPPRISTVRKDPCCRCDESLV